MINGDGSARPSLEAAGGCAAQRALRRVPAEGAAARGAGHRRHPRRAAAGRARARQRAVEDLLDPGRRPAGARRDRSRHRGAAHPRRRRARASPSRPTTRPRSSPRCARCSPTRPATAAMGAPGGRGSSGAASPAAVAAAYEALIRQVADETVRPRRARDCSCTVSGADSLAYSWLRHRLPRRSPSSPSGQGQEGALPGRHPLPCSSSSSWSSCSARSSSTPARAAPTRLRSRPRRRPLARRLRHVRLRRAVACRRCRRSRAALESRRAAAADQHDASSSPACTATTTASSTTTRTHRQGDRHERQARRVPRHLRRRAHRRPSSSCRPSSRRPEPAMSSKRARPTCTSTARSKDASIKLWVWDSYTDTGNRLDDYITDCATSALTQRRHGVRHRRRARGRRPEIPMPPWAASCPSSALPTVGNVAPTTDRRPDHDVPTGDTTRRHRRRHDVDRHRDTTPTTDADARQRPPPPAADARRRPRRRVRHPAAAADLHVPSRCCRSATCRSSSGSSPTSSAAASPRSRWRSASSPSRSSRRSPTAPVRGATLRYAVEPEPLDTAGAIRFAADPAGIDDTFVVANGDVLTDLDIGALVAFHRDRRRRGHDAPHAGRRSVGVRRRRLDDDGRVERFVEKPPPGTAPSNLINAGTYVLEPSVLAAHPGRPARCRSSGRRSPRSSATAALYAMATDDYWIDTGRPSCTCRPTSTSSAARRAHATATVSAPTPASASDVCVDRLGRRRRCRRSATAPRHPFGAARRCPSAPGPR